MGSNSTNSTNVDRVLYASTEWALTNRVYWLLSISVTLNVSSVMCILCNGTLFLTFMLFKQLRLKEYMMMAFQAMFDCMGAFFMLCMSSFDYGLTQNRFYCMFTVRNLAYMVGYHNGGIMLFIVSMDRFLAVKLPVWYWKQSMSYIYKWLALLATYNLFYQAYQIKDSFLYSDMIIPQCLTSHSYTNFSFDLRLLSALLFSSIVIHGFVFVYYRRNLLNRVEVIIQVSPENMAKQNKAWNLYKKKLGKLTKTLAISSIITLFTAAIPNYAFDLWRLKYPELQSVGWLILGMPYWGMAANLALYVHRHKDVREGVKALLSCRKYKKVNEVKATIAP